MNAISPSMYWCAQLFSPISPVISGTRAASGAMLLCQQPLLLHALKLYECHEAARLFAESVGANWLHEVMSFENDRPPSMITFVAPALRMVLTSCCMPATGMLLPELSRSMLGHALPPSRQHVQLGAPAPRPWKS